jgi:hypothetical protein
MLLKMTGSVSAQIRPDIENKSILHSMSRSLRVDGLTSVRVEEDRVIFERNFGHSRLFLFAHFGTFVIERQGDYTSIYYDVSLIKLWIIATLVIAILNVPMWLSPNVGGLARFYLLISSFVLICGVNYLMLLLRIRMFIGRTLRQVAV